CDWSGRSRSMQENIVRGGSGLREGGGPYRGMGTAEHLRAEALAPDSMPRQLSSHPEGMAEMNQNTSTPKFVVATPGRSVCDLNARALEKHCLLRFIALGTRRGTAGVSLEH